MSQHISHREEPFSRRMVRLSQTDEFLYNCARRKKNRAQRIIPLLLRLRHLISKAYFGHTSTCGGSSDSCMYDSSWGGFTFPIHSSLTWPYHLGISWWLWGLLWVFCTCYLVGRKCVTDPLHAHESLLYHYLIRIRHFLVVTWWESRCSIIINVCFIKIHSSKGNDDIFQFGSKLHNTRTHIRTEFGLARTC